MLIAIFLALAASNDFPDILLKPSGSYYIFESFGDDDWKENWTVSLRPNYTGQWEVQTTLPPQSYPNEKMIFMKSSNSYYGLSTQFASPLDPRGKTLIVQYEIRDQESLMCGGTYIKLFGKDNFSPSTLCNETRYIIMFGPDKCGAHSKLHFIFRHRNPKTGEYEEKRLRDTPIPKSGNLNHVYTLIVRPDNSYEIMIDTETAKEGSLLTDFTPPVNLPKEIDDPNDVKPIDWADDETIPDPDARNPDDWD
jgi:calnexin